MTTHPPLKLYGSPISTFVRKVLLLLKHKGLPFTIEMPDRETLLAMHPMGKVPVLRHGEVLIVDSSVICDYLERIHPEKPLTPADPRARASCLWIEEYCDTFLQDAFYPYVNEVIFKPKVYGQPTDVDVRDNALRLGCERLDYLEQQLNGPYFVGETLTLADITLGTVLVNPLRFGFELDRGRWPKLSANIDNLYASEPFASVLADAEPDYVALANRKPPQ